MASAPGATCSNISIMQLFHQLKQDFPAAPDEVVMQCVRQHADDKEACERALQGRAAHGAYPSALMTGAARMPMSGPSAAPCPAPCPLERLGDHSAPAQGPGQGRQGKEGAALTDMRGAPEPTATVHRPPRKLRPAPPPPAGARLDAPSAPPSTPPRLRPAPPPPGSGGFAIGPDAAGPAGPASPRHTATMAIQPAAPYGVGVVPPRSYTSVNLTLRPPAADQPPIDIHTGGSSLTYSTSSYDPRQGYQSQLQIRIGPGGLGSVSAMRTRSPPAAPPAPRPPRLMSPLPEGPEGPEDTARRPPASREDLERTVVAMGGADLSPDMREHLVRQLERRALLETELCRERGKLRAMQREVAEMERDLERRSALAHHRPRGPPALPVMEKVQRLRTEIQALQEECTRMTNEVDAKAPETRLEESNSEPGWTCQTCTFHNHYLLESCETCDVPRIRLGHAATQDIHIRVTHHNFSSRSLHGWVD